MNGNDELRLQLGCRFRKEFLFSSGIRFCQACHAQEQNVCLVAVHLTFDVIETWAYHVFLIPGLHIEVIRTAFFIITQSGIRI